MFPLESCEIRGEDGITGWPEVLSESGFLVPSPGGHCQPDKDSLTAPGWQGSAAVKCCLWFLQENNLLKRISSINVIINLEKTYFSIK